MFKALKILTFVLITLTSCVLQGITVINQTDNPITLSDFSLGTITLLWPAFELEPALKTAPIGNVLRG